MENAPAFMSPGTQYSEEFWLSNEVNYQGDFQDYNHLLDAMKRRPSSTSGVSADDEEDILYLLGSINKDDTVETYHTYFFEEGQLKEIDEGPYRMITRDKEGTVVTEQSFNTSSQHHSGGSEVSESSTDVGAFSFPMRYPLSVRSVELGKAGEILTTYNVTTSTLHQAINEIPAGAFRRNDEEGNNNSGKKEGDDNDKQSEKLAENRRKALHKKVDAVGRKLDAGNERGAAQKLKNDVRPAIERWVESDYSTSRPVQYTQEQVLQIVARHIQRLD